MNKLLRKLLLNPGYLLFLHGSAAAEPPSARVPDSESPEYYYLIQQRARVAVQRQVLSGRGLLGFPKRVGLAMFFGLKLWMVNRLVESYINEAKLLELTKK